MTCNPMGNPMKTTTRLLLIACLALPFLAACKKEEAPKVEVAAALTAPTTTDEAAWNAGQPRHTAGILKRSAAREPVDFVTLFNQQLREV